MGKFVDLTGQRFGKLVVVEQDKRTRTGRIKWICLCDCGKRHRVLTGHLKSGSITNCGCEKSRRTSERNTKHGGSKSRIYNIWIKMRDRCKNPNNEDWDLYGGKGIKVCPEWDESFESFRDWSFKNGYSSSRSIDRINGNQGYCPDNCRWATAKEQANNVSTNHIVSYRGKRMTLSEAADISKVSYATLKARIMYYGWPIEKAVETPVIDNKNHRRKEHGISIRSEGQSVQSTP